MPPGRAWVFGIPEGAERQERFWLILVFRVLRVLKLILAGVSGVSRFLSVMLPHQGTDEGCRGRSRRVHGEIAASVSYFGLLPEGASVIHGAGLGDMPALAFPLKQGLFPQLCLKIGSFQ